MSSLIQLRRGTAAQWTSQTLAAGEIGYETDTGNFKIGDGTTGWATLAYFMSPLLTSASTDLDNADYLRMGRFNLTAPATTYTNGPALLDATEGTSRLIVTKFSAGYIQQIVSTNYFFTRVYTNGSWQPWKQLPTSETTNTVNTLVRRDASGNFAAGTITANLTGNVTGVLTGSLATARTIAITGDVAYSQSFDGSANITGAGTLATVATAGATGSSTAIPVVTINAKGLTTGITTVAVIAPAGTLSGATLNSTVTASSLTSFGSSPTLVTPVLGTPTSGLLTNCTSSSTPSGSTNLATKGYVDNPPLGAVQCYQTITEPTTAGTQTYTLYVGDYGTSITLTVVRDQANWVGNGTDPSSYAVHMYVSSGKLYWFNSQYNGVYYSYADNNTGGTNTISQTYIGTFVVDQNFVYSKGIVARLIAPTHSAVNGFGNTARWGLGVSVPVIPNYFYGYWTP